LLTKYFIVIWRINAKRHVYQPTGTMAEEPDSQVIRERQTNLLILWQKRDRSTGWSSGNERQINQLVKEQETDRSAIWSSSNKTQINQVV